MGAEMFEDIGDFLWPLVLFGGILFLVLTNEVAQVLCLGVVVFFAAWFVIHAITHRNDPPSPPSNPPYGGL